MLRLILGHLVGDYLFQTRYMARMKSANSILGFLWCIFHCIVYTMTVCIFIGNFSPLAAFIIFNSHFWIDKFSLAKYWMVFLNGKKYMMSFTKMPTDHNALLEMIFGSFVYIVIDNSFQF